MKSVSSLIWFIFTFAIIPQINCQPSRKGLISKFCSKPKNKLNLNIFNVNVWALSYFDDLPIPSTSEAFDVDSVRETLTEYLNESYPNPLLLPVLLGLEDASLIGLLNSAKKKQERLSTLCDHIMDQEFDVVFMQEVWFKNDYKFLKQCTRPKYRITEFDKECGRLNPMTALECSGLVTLVKRSKKSKLKQKFITIPKGTDFASITDPELYGEYIITRKALIVDTKIPAKKFKKGVPLRFINTHLTPYNTDMEQNRQLRIQQAEFICDKALKTRLQGKRKWAWAILGMDMNDIPGDSVYEIFMNCGFSDAYNPNQSNMITYPLTYATPGNTWTKPEEEKVTLDYVFAMGRSNLSPSIYTMDVDFKKVKVEDLKTTPNDVSLSDHNSVFAKIKLGCNPFFYYVPT